MEVSKRSKNGGFCNTFTRRKCNSAHAKAHDDADFECK